MSRYALATFEPIRSFKRSWFGYREICSKVERSLLTFRVTTTRCDGYVFLLEDKASESDKTPTDSGIAMNMATVGGKYGGDGSY